MLLLCCTVLTAYGQQADKPEQQLFYFGKMAVISIDKQLYVSDTSDFFYIHVSIKNSSGNVLGIDLTSPQYLLFPNQWQFSDTIFRRVIDETQIIPDEVNAARATELAGKLKANKLTTILPAQTFDYYTEFNADMPGDDAQVNGAYLIVSIDGQMFFTDGTNMEHVKCNGDLNVDRELALKCPLVWKKISDKQNIRHR